MLFEATSYELVEKVAELGVVKKDNRSVGNMHLKIKGGKIS